MEKVMFNQTTVRHTQGICAFSCVGLRLPSQQVLFQTNQEYGKTWQSIVLLWSHFYVDQTMDKMSSPPSLIQAIITPTHNKNEQGLTLSPPTQEEMQRDPGNEVEELLSGPTSDRKVVIFLDDNDF